MSLVVGGHTLNDAGVRLADELEKHGCALSENHGVLAKTNENGRDASINSTTNSEREVDADQECEQYDRRSVLALGVVGRLGICLSAINTLLAYI